MPFKDHMQFFAYQHLPSPLKETSQLFHDLAYRLLTEIPDNSEKEMALRKLLEAKDCAVRAKLYKDHVYQDYKHLEELREKVLSHAKALFGSYSNSLTYLRCVESVAEVVLRNYNYEIRVLAQGEILILIDGPIGDFEE